MKTAPNSAQANIVHRILGKASAVPTSTGTTDAERVFGRAASSQEVVERRQPGGRFAGNLPAGGLGAGGPHGNLGNFLKSGFRCSTNALRPSCASSER